MKKLQKYSHISSQGENAVLSLLAGNYRRRTTSPRQSSSEQEMRYVFWDQKFVSENK